MLFTTEIKAINQSGELVIFRGPLIVAPSIEIAELYCENNGLGYCHVTGKFAYYSESKGKIVNINNN